jgi:hypothetical protein
LDEGAAAFFPRREVARRCGAPTFNDPRALLSLGVTEGTGMFAAFPGAASATGGTRGAADRGLGPGDRELSLALPASGIGVTAPHLGQRAFFPACFSSTLNFASHARQRHAIDIRRIPTPPLNAAEKCNRVFRPVVRIISRFGVRNNRRRRVFRVNFADESAAWSIS